MIKINKKIEFKIAVDGSSASGKTTAGKLIAKKLKMKFLSSGTLYRFCALKTLENKNSYNEKCSESKGNIFVWERYFFFLKRWPAETTDSLFANPR